MKAAAFDYVRADSLPEALTLLARHGEDAKLLAGGQSLLPALNLRLSAPGVLLDIGRIAALRGIALQASKIERSYAFSIRRRHDGCSTHNRKRACAGRHSRAPRFNCQNSRHLRIWRWYMIGLTSFQNH